MMDREFDGAMCLHLKCNPNKFMVKHIEKNQWCSFIFSTKSDSMLRESTSFRKHGIFPSGSHFNSDTKRGRIGTANKSGE